MTFKFLQIFIINARPLREFFLSQFFVRAELSERLSEILSNCVH